MIKIKHADKLYITGRGLVFPIDLNDQDQSLLVKLAQYGLDKIKQDGIKVHIEDSDYTIRGIERFGGGEASFGPKVGLLVKKVEDEV